MWEGLRNVLSVKVGNDVVFSSAINGDVETGELWCKTRYPRDKNHLRIKIRNGQPEITEHAGIFSNFADEIQARMSKKKTIAA